MQTISGFLAGTGEKIQVGSIEIRALPDGSFYMERTKGESEGEGTQIPRRIFVDMIEEFYKENF